MVQQSPKTPKIVCRAGRQQLMWRYQLPFYCPGSPWRPLTPSSTCWILQPTTPPPATSCTALWFIPLFTRQVSNSFFILKCTDLFRNRIWIMIRYVYFISRSDPEPAAKYCIPNTGYVLIFSVLGRDAENGDRYPASQCKAHWRCSGKDCKFSTFFMGI